MTPKIEITIKEDFSYYPSFYNPVIKCTPCTPNIKTFKYSVYYEHRQLFCLEDSILLTFFSESDNVFENKVRLAALKNKYDITFNTPKEMPYSLSISPDTFPF